MAGMQNFNQPSSQPSNKPPIPPGAWILFILVFLTIMLLSVLTFAFRNYILGAFTTGLGVFLFFVADNTPFSQIRDHIAEKTTDALDQLLSQTISWMKENAAEVAVLILCITLLRVYLNILPLTNPVTVTLSHCDHLLNMSTQRNGETIGLGTSCVVFDTRRADGNVKNRAATLFMQGHIQDGITALAKEHAKDSGDAELLIDAANQQVLLTALSLHTVILHVIVATILTGKYVYMGRDELQGIATAQHEFNQENTTLKLIVTIANMGSNQGNATSAANQIANAVIHSSTNIGIIGPPLCSQTQTLLDTLKAKKIELPVISPDASCDNLTNYSPELYQIAPSNAVQAQIAAWYMQKVLQAKRVVIVTNKADTNDTFNQARDFMKAFPLQKIVETYEPGDTQRIIAGLRDAMQLKPAPDAILFTGVSDDLNSLLANLPTTGPFAHIPVVGLDPLYSLGGYDQANREMRANFQRLRLVALFFPDEAIFLKEAQPALLADYPELFDPNRTHPGGIYGFSRMDSAAALTYDALKVLLHALPSSTTNINARNILAGLVNTAYDSAWQGATGQIDFLDGTVPYKKAIVILTVDANDKFHMVMLAGGCYEKNQCNMAIKVLPDIAFNLDSLAHRYVFFRYNKNNPLIVRMCF